MSHDGNGFCVERLSVPAQLRARAGVLRAGSLAITCDARRAADLILQEAREAAAAMRATAALDAAEAVSAERRRVAHEASQLLNGLRAAQERLLENLGQLAFELAERAFERLVFDMTPRERIAAAVRRVCEEAPQRLAAAVAWVHPDDLPLVEAAPWELRADPRLAPGSCRLEASSGEWLAVFDLGAATLQEALRAQATLFTAQDVDQS